MLACKALGVTTLNFEFPVISGTTEAGHCGYAYGRLSSIWFGALFAKKKKMRTLSEWLTARINAWDARRAPRLCANNLRWLRSRLTGESDESRRRIIERQIELWEKRLAGEIDDAVLYQALGETPLLTADGTPDDPRSACGCYAVVLILVLVLVFETWAYCRHLERKADAMSVDTSGAAFPVDK